MTLSDAPPFRPTATSSVEGSVLTVASRLTR